MNDLKGLILSGGKGTRLRPITHTSAKQLVPVANKPILYYGLEAMAEAGIKQVGMIVGDTENEVRAAAGERVPKPYGYFNDVMVGGHRIAAKVQPEREMNAESIVTRETAR